MTFLLFIVFVLAAVLLVKEDPGFVLIQYWDYTLETTLAFGVVALAVAIIVLNIVLKILLSILRIPTLLSAHREQRRIEKGRFTLNKGLIDLAEARFEQAEKKLTQYLSLAETPLLNYLTAARAAHLQGKFEQRDEYLKEAHAVSPEAKIAIGVTQGELQLAAKQYERAYATLSRLHESSPKHAYVLKLLAKTYLELEQWEELKKILPDLKKKQLFIDKKLAEIEEATYIGCLSQLCSPDEESLEKVFKEIRKNCPQNKNLLMAYLDRLSELGGLEKRIEKVIIDTLAKQWDQSLVIRFGLIEHENINLAIATAEKWLEHHSHDANLLLTLGRLARKAQLWGKAQQFLESSIQLAAKPENCLEMASLFENDLKDINQATHFYKKGLMACVESDSTDITVAAIS